MLFPGPVHRLIYILVKVKAGYCRIIIIAGWRMDVLHTPIPWYKNAVTYINWVRLPRR